MARIHGSFLFGELSGKLGGNTYYRGKNGKTIVRKCTPIGKERFATDPKLEFMRRNAAEFTNAAKAVKLLLNAVGDTGRQFRSSDCFSRLQREMLQVIKADRLNAHGMRNVLDGDLRELEGFQLNNEFRFLPVNTIQNWEVNRKEGSATLSFRQCNNPYVPSNVKNARCQRIIAIAVAINFSTGVFCRNEKISDMMMIGNAEIKLSCQLPGDNRDPWFLLGGIEWYRHGDMRPGESRFHALSIMKVSGSE